MRRRERGEISFGCLLMTALIVVGVYHAYFFILPYYHNYSFDEQLFTMSEHMFRQSRAEIDRMIIETAAASGVKITPQNISYRETSTEVFIEVNYKVPVDTPLLKRVLSFRVVTNRKFSR